MLREDQKIYGYVKEGADWIEFDAWSLLKLSDGSETKYREWHSKYEKRIHVNRDLDSPLIFFHRGHGTFSYFSEKDKISSPNSTPVTLSHILRQKVIAERAEATFSIRNLINKKINTKKEVKIEYKKVLVEQTIYVDGEPIRPDITIEFDEPIELALKWNNKLYVEVVESNETNGYKIGLLKKLGHGVIEIPYSEHFDIFKGRKFKDVSKKEVDDLEFKIKNFFKNSIWADLIVDPVSEEYKKLRLESIYYKKYESLNKENKNLQETAESLKDSLQQVSQNYNGIQEDFYNLKYERDSLKKTKQKLEDDITILQDMILNWNDKGFLYKFIKGFKVT